MGFGNFRGIDTIQLTRDTAQFFIHGLRGENGQFTTAKLKDGRVILSSLVGFGFFQPVDRLVEFAEAVAGHAKSYITFLSPTLKEQPGGAEVPAVVHDLLTLDTLFAAEEQWSLERIGVLRGLAAAGIHDSHRGWPQSVSGPGVLS